MRYLVTALDAHGTEETVGIDAASEKEAAEKARASGFKPYRIIQDTADPSPGKRRNGTRAALSIIAAGILVLAYIGTTGLWQSSDSPSVRTLDPGKSRPGPLRATALQDNADREDNSLLPGGERHTDQNAFVGDPNRVDSGNDSDVLPRPTVDWVEKRLLLDGWVMGSRKDNVIVFERNAYATGDAGIVLTPSSAVVKVDVAELDVFLNCARVLGSAMALDDRLDKKISSVTNSPRYLQANFGAQASWKWAIGGYQVTFTHSKDMEMLDIRRQ